MTRLILLFALLLVSPANATGSGEAIGGFFVEASQPQGWEGSHSNYSYDADDDDDD